MSNREILNAVDAHWNRGRCRHPRWADYSAAAHFIDDRVSKLHAAIGSSSDKDHLHQIARRALQLSGMCCRLVADFGLPVMLPPHHLPNSQDDDTDDANDTDAPVPPIKDKEVADGALTSMSLRELHRNMEHEDRYPVHSVEIDAPHYKPTALEVLTVLRTPCPRCQHAHIHPLVYANAEWRDWSIWGHCHFCAFIWKP